MAARCDVCGKGPAAGNSVTRRGSTSAWRRRKPKTKRRWHPNLHSMKARVNGGTKRVKVCSSCLKAGKVTKVV